MRTAAAASGLIGAVVCHCSVSSVSEVSAEPAALLIEQWHTESPASAINLAGRRHGAFDKDRQTAMAAPRLALPRELGCTPVSIHAEATASLVEPAHRVRLAPAGGP